MNAVPGRRPRRLPHPAPLLLAALLLLAGAPRALARDAASIPLGARARADVRADGSVLLADPVRAAAPALLTIHAPWTVTTADGAPFFLLTREGAPGGHRGLSDQADDDHDGRTDEDPADGRDNDGDGAVDEDYAAVGETMVVVDRGTADQARRLEASHWSLPHLSEALVLRWRTAADAAEPVRLTLPRGEWHRGRLGWSLPNHPEAAEKTLFSARVTAADGRTLWLGLLLLDGGAAALPSARLDGAALELTPRERLTMAVAVCASPHQLRARLAAVQATRAGAPAAPGRAPTPWIAPPPPVRPRDVTAQAWLRRDAQGRTRVEMAVPRAWTLLLDPETFLLDGAPLEAPRLVTWEREGVAGGDEPAQWSLAPAPAKGAAPPPALYADLPAAARRGPSLWTFVFDGRELPEGAVFLDARSVDGLPLQFTLERAPDLTAADEAEKTTRGATLAPHLLENYPNPFRDQLSVRFTVPTTVGEGFVWEEGEEPALKASDPIPYADPMPRAVLTIYSLAGHEVAKLFDDRCSPGAYQGQWNGLDRDGRQVAAGTYFCKLQIENWSVTKRVALIR